MPILFISLSQSFTEKIKHYGFEAYTMKIQDYQPNPQKKTYYVSPANSLCFMDGGIDYALSRIVFPGIESDVKEQVKQLGRQSLLGRPYLPIGSSLILDRGQSALIVAPTMLLPQNVSKTQNAYYATMSILHAILVKRAEDLETIDILLTSLCCGYGKMEEDESIRQILKGIRDYKNYTPEIINSLLHQQPKYYQNSEFFEIRPEEIQRV